MREHAHQHLDRRALARPVGSEQAERAAAGDLQRQIVDRQGAAESFGQADKLDGRTVLGWSAHGRLLPSWVPVPSARACVEDFPNLRRAHAGDLAGANGLVERPADAVAGQRLGGRRAPLGDKKPPAALRIDQAFPLQFVVGPLHRVRVDVDFGGHGPQRGQHLAGPIHAGGHRCADAVGDLQVDRYVAAGIDLHVGILSCIS